MSGPTEVWLLDLDDVELLARAAAVLAADEHAELAPLHFGHDRRRRAAARTALRTVAGDALGVAPADVELRRDEHGKPRVPGDPVHLSVSHAGAVGAVARAPVAVGIDVEHVRPRHADLGVAARWFAPTELAMLEAQPPADRASTFTLLWTAKEAVLKAQGTGLAGGLDRVVLHLEADGRPVLRAVGGEDPADWTLVALTAPHGHRAAVAVRAPGAEIVVRDRLPG